MADFTLQADGDSIYTQMMGTNSESDTTTVVVGELFGLPSGTAQIQVTSSSVDNFTETVVMDLPPGWTIELRSISTNDSESPSFKTITYFIYDDADNLRGSMIAQANTFVNAPVCFTTGTMIQTPNGENAVEDLTVGDLVLTKDHGPQAIRWIGSRRFTAAALALQDNLRPVRIRAGALGDGVPAADLVVSQQHRILVRSRIAQRMFGASEVLVAAKQLLALPGIEIATDLDEVEYFHFLFEQHEVVIANGAEAESLFPGAEALKSVGKAAAEEIMAIFPQLENVAVVPNPARAIAHGRQGRQLAERHARNSHRLQ